ncbi:hypothetical protein HAX54_029640 [Datura stramonium]|uniref:Uncharacterized protein n=1 Tax=Datura stramonium TaxID=4076 RepID=A0ABS8SAC0_DATST|nr:hypothetical protein [Datura stramonium]
MELQGQLCTIWLVKKEALLGELLCFWCCFWSWFIINSHFNLVGSAYFEINVTNTAAEVNPGFPIDEQQSNFHIVFFSVSQKYWVEPAIVLLYTIRISMVISVLS